MTDNAGTVRPRIRVAAYVVRQRDEPGLLVFDHVGLPEAGTQVPAGGVGPGESLEEAVLREVFEETGLRVTVVRQIATENRPHPGTGLPRRTTFFYLRVPAETPDAWVHRVRGDGEDDGLTFDCRFLPLPLERPLADAQDTWLGCVDRRWTTAAGGAHGVPRGRATASG
ncbi:NUDIX hydrolase [Streptomyces qinzhouensis]|uniref:NUDIX domain-containing protein n=1 Tax=Streptomyces qinzhouensis TaxID=2599401 RepID=A0A5B8J1Y0_9ACTN|nr:NUDIX domain-containing protein [Streptomyces qinzhouensis]QDY75247.1 NUDIX domain-containing protein [Streptomyces qinzhouensis]